MAGFFPGIRKYAENVQFRTQNRDRKEDRRWKMYLLWSIR